jgi:predicted peroxiredoxin
MTRHRTLARYRRAAAIALAVFMGLGSSLVAARQEARVSNTGSKPSILVHVTHGPEQPTRAALAFLVARTAQEEGHKVTLFLAGDAVQLLRDAVLDGTAGVGTGRLRDHYDAIVKGGGRFYLSGMSSAARGVTAAELANKPAEMAPPTTLLRLALEHERMFTY